jgi:hypothetical protein
MQSIARLHTATKRLHIQANRAPEKRKLQTCALDLTILESIADNRETSCLQRYKDASIYRPAVIRNNSSNAIVDSYQCSFSGFLGTFPIILSGMILAAVSGVLSMEMVDTGPSGRWRVRCYHCLLARSKPCLG